MNNNGQPTKTSYHQKEKTSPSNNSDCFVRNEAVYGTSAMQRLKDAKVVVLGLGGVGSFCATALARAGVGQLTIVDFDTIETSNINRQEFALHSTVGKRKTDVAQKLIEDINPQIKLNIFSEKIDRSNIEKILEDQDFIADAIDDVPAKLLVAKYAQDHNVRIISCMGTAQRVRPDMLQYADLYDTSVCPLCKAARKEARKVGILTLPVVYSKEVPVVAEGMSKTTLGSVSFVPPVAGNMLAGFVVNKICEISKK